MLLPLIPTGLALRMLVATGHAGDPRVEAAFASLLALAGPVHDTDGALVHLEGWCAHKCVFLLEDIAKARRKAKKRGIK